MADRNPLSGVGDGHTLAKAIVDTVREALVVLNRDLRVVVASRSFYQTFRAEPQNTQGRMFYELGNGQWNIPALRNLLEDVIPKHRTIEAYEVEHEFPTIGRRILLLNARQVFDEEHPDATLLLAIEDVTERRNAEREKDELLRQKEMLLQEMQHRVANSLQIIASILLLKARTVQSEETRGIIDLLEVEKACLQNPSEIRTSVAGHGGEQAHCFHDRHVGGSNLDKHIFFELGQRRLLPDDLHQKERRPPTIVPPVPAVRKIKSHLARSKPLLIFVGKVSTFEQVIVRPFE